MFRNVLSLIVVVALALSFGSCGKDPTASAQSSEKAKTEIKTEKKVEQKAPAVDPIVAAQKAAQPRTVIIDEATRGKLEAAIQVMQDTLNNAKPVTANDAIKVLQDTVHNNTSAKQVSADEALKVLEQQAMSPRTPSNLQNNEKTMTPEEALKVLQQAISTNTTATEK